MICPCTIEDVAFGLQTAKEAAEAAARAVQEAEEAAELATELIAAADKFDRETEETVEQDKEAAQ